MFTHLDCITLRTVRYDDSHIIVGVWTRSHGYVSLIVSAGGSREGRRRRALMMPLGMFEGESDMRPGKTIHSIRDVRPTHVAVSLTADPMKSVVAMFLAEVLDRILRDTLPDSRLTDFVFGAIRWLDTTPSAHAVANFPLIFLFRLGTYLGIAPDTDSWRPGKIFDLTGGIFRDSAPTAGRWLNPDEARWVAMLGRLSFAASERLAIDRATRRRILHIILEYYTLHHTPPGTLKSLSVVTELF